MPRALPFAPTDICRFTNVSTLIRGSFQTRLSLVSASRVRSLELAYLPLDRLVFAIDCSASVVHDSRTIERRYSIAINRNRVMKMASAGDSARAPTPSGTRKRGCWEKWVRALVVEERGTEDGRVCSAR